MIASENLRGMALMTAAMFFFASADAFIKVLSQSHPAGQIIWISGLAGAIGFTIAVLFARQRPVTRDVMAPGVLLRLAAEGVGTVCIILALSRAPLSVVVTITQSMPLLVTLGASVFLGEAVGWRRWTAILVGLMGVLVILRPGTDGMTPGALFAVMAAISLSTRDLATRVAPRTASSLQLSAWGFWVLVPAGLILMQIQGSAPGPYTANAIAMLTAISVLAGLAILCVTMAMRVGDVAAVSPFRYARLIFGLALAVIWFGERPDLTTWLGAAIISASGLYTFYRERRQITAAG